MVTLNARLYNALGALLCAALLFAGTSCEEVIPLELDEAEARLVVEGSVERKTGPDSTIQRIRLSTTGPFFSSGRPTPRVTDARVRIFSSLDEYVELTHEGDGVFVTNELGGAIGATYTLQIDWNSQRYEAVETLNAVSPIDSIYYRFIEETAFEDEGNYIFIDTSDPPGGPNYYYWKTYVNGRLILEAGSANEQSIIADDELVDGQIIKGIQPNEEVAVETGAHVRIEQLSISETYYNFLREFLELTSGEGSVFDSPPAPVRGNIRNLDNPQAYGLGYFSANDVARAEITIR